MTLDQARLKAQQAQENIYQHLQTLSDQVAVKEEQLKLLGSLVNMVVRFNQMEWPSELLQRAKRMADEQEVPMEQFVVSIVREALDKREGKANIITVNGEMYARIFALADGRNCPVEAVTESDDFTEWLRQGLDNMRF